MDARHIGQEKACGPDTKVRFILKSGHEPFILLIILISLPIIQVLMLKTLSFREEKAKVGEATIMRMREG